MARKAYEDASKEYRVNKAKYYGIIKRNIKEGSVVWNAARRFDENCDSEALLKRFDVAYKSKICFTRTKMKICRSIMMMI